MTGLFQQLGIMSVYPCCCFRSIGCTPEIQASFKLSRPFFLVRSDESRDTVDKSVTTIISLSFGARRDSPLPSCWSTTTFRSFETCKCCFLSLHYSSFVIPKSFFSHGHIVWPLDFLGGKNRVGTKKQESNGKSSHHLNDIGKWIHWWMYSERN